MTAMDGILIVFNKRGALNEERHSKEGLSIERQDLL